MYYVLRFLSQCIQKLSDESLDVLAKILRFAAFDLLKIRRELLMRNVATAFPDRDEKSRCELARESIYHFALNILEFLGAAGPEATSHCEFAGRENLEAALAKGEGAYILCCHLGNWEILGAAVNRHIRQVRVLVKRVGGPGTDRFVEEKRTAIGMHTIKRRGRMDAIKAIRNALKENEVVGFVLDQSRPGEPLLPFFGRPAKTNTSLAMVWERLKAPIVPAFIERLAPNRHRIHLLPELKLSSSGDREQDIIDHTRYFNKVIEGMIQQKPEQYFWLHNRWKT